AKSAVADLVIAAEMTPSLLGIKDDATAESAAKMRLNAINAIAMAQRKSAYWQAGLSLAISLAIEADFGAPPRGEIGVEMRDGLPVDEVERAGVIATLRSADACSLNRALRMQWMSEQAVAEEKAEILKEKKAATPSVLLDEQDDE